MKLRKGFSILEVLLAVAAFAIFSVATGVTVLSGLDTNRQSVERTVALQYAAEGFEAARAIRNQDFTIFATPSAVIGVVQKATGEWVWAGSNNTFDTGRYTRTITVSSVNRDGSGNIVASGGTNDPNTKKILSKVNWDFKGGIRAMEASVAAYLTNWKAAINSSLRGGIIVYGDGTTTPVVRSYDATANTFSAEGPTVAGALGRNFIVKTSSVSAEAIVGYTNNAGTLQVMCYNGTTWSNEWSVSVGGTGTTRRFDIAYESQSGDVMVVYSTNAGTTNELAYRTKPGATGCGTANWSSATNYDAVRTSGIVHWVRAEGSPVNTSNNIAVAWADANSDLSAVIWTGSSFGVAEPSSALETNLERASASQDVQSFDIAYETMSGELMVVWGLSQATTCTAGTVIAATNCIRYATYTGSWSAVAVIPTVADPATNIDIAADPLSNALALAALDNSQADLSCAYWSGSAWTGKANQDTATRVAAAGTRLVAVGWLNSGATKRSIIVYNDSATTNVGWVVGSTGTFTTQTDFTPTPVFANPQSWYQIDVDPFNPDRLIFSLSDNASDLHAKRLVMTSTPAFTWTNSNGAAVLEATLGQATAGPFGFSYWRKP